MRFLLLSGLFLLLLGVNGYLAPAELDTLIKKLSKEAEVHYEGSPNYAAATAYINPRIQPQIDFAVQATTIADVNHTIEFARNHRRPLAIRTTGHGNSHKLSEVRDGVQLSLRRFTSIEIDPNGESVRLGSGVNNHELVTALWKAKKRTATLGCDCVSIVGGALGGGHGYQQGLYGLVSDQMISITLLIANGSVVEASEAVNPDLFWAMKGAGHNFGVVLEIALKLYDIPPGWGDSHIITDYFFNLENLDQVVESLNMIVDGPQDPELNIFARFRSKYIKVRIQYSGNRPVNDLIPPMFALMSFSSSEQIVPWPQVPAATGLGLENRTCELRAGEYRSSASVMMTSLRSEVIRESLALMDDASVKMKSSGIGQRSFLFVELYGRGKFEDVELAEKSVYGHRDMRVIVTFETAYHQANDMDKADAHVNTAKQLLLKHRQERVYINYANGYEGSLAWYGNETNLKKLEKIKNEYDPHGVFSVFSPFSTKAPFEIKDEL
ncbi:hypothetical protein F5884DRAFT_25755 [Xylogone sp. PMI_703]|nr:hypothetical protein F5884DRAFT_25755 [Xylogone sp. PMI_703]